MQYMQVGSLIQEDPLEKEMAAHSSILACRIPWTEKPVGLPSSSVQFSCSVVSYSLLHGLLIAVASLVVEHGL